MKNKNKPILVTLAVNKKNFFYTLFSLPSSCPFAHIPFVGVVSFLGLLKLFFITALVYIPHSGGFLLGYIISLLVVCVDLRCRFF